MTSRIVKLVDIELNISVLLSFFAIKTVKLYKEERIVEKKSTFAFYT